MAKLLFQASIADGAAVSAVAMLAAVALLACDLPALGAARMDPLVALRSE